MSYLFGVDLGGTRIKSVALAPDGAELARDVRATCDDGAAGFRESVREAVAELTHRLGPPQAVGLAAPGLARPDNRAIAHMPGRLQGLEDFVWSDWLQQDAHVFNDAHAALAGEVWCGAARGCQHAFMLTLGTGVGGAILADGRILQGSIGRAGHLGHITLDPTGPPDIVNTPASLEDAIGDHNVLARTDGRFASNRELVEAYLQGEEAASAVWLKSVHSLAAAIASLINVLDPEVIVLGGGVAAAGEALLGPLRARLENVEWRPGGHSVPLVLAALGDYAGAMGAASMAAQQKSSQLD